MFNSTGIKFGGNASILKTTAINYTTGYSQLKLIKMSLNTLKTDFLEMLELQGEISKYNQMLLHHNDMNDKRNFNLEKCDRIKSKVSQLQERFYYLKEKWFVAP